MYQSLAFFVLFESDDFVQKLGKQIHEDKVLEYRAKFEKLSLNE